MPYEYQPILVTSFGDAGSGNNLSGGSLDPGEHAMSVSGGSTEAVATGDTAGFYVVDIGFVVSFDPEPATEDSAVGIAITYEPQGHVGVNNTYTVSISTSAGTITSPTLVENIHGWTIGTWSTSDGGVTYTATHTKADSVGIGYAGGAIFFSTTPSAAGTITVNITTSTNQTGVTTTYSDSCTVNASWTMDATSGVGVPASAAEWTTVRAAAGLSGSMDHLWLCQEASGNLLDSIGSFNLIPSGTLARQQAVTGWDRDGVDFDVGVSEYVSNSSPAVNPSTSSVLWLGYIDFDGVGTTIYTLMVSGAALTLEVMDDETLRFGIFNGLQSRSRVTYSGVHPVMVMADHTGSRLICVTDLESMSIRWETPGSSDYLYVGGAVYAAPAMKWIYGAMGLDANAELSLAQMSALLTTLGWSPAFSTISYYLHRTGGVSGNWDSQAYSTETFAGTCSVEWTVSYNQSIYSIGLSADNPDASYTGIDRALLLDGGIVYKNENGSLTSYGSFNNGDKFKVERDGSNNVTYYRDSGSGWTSLGSGTSLSGSLIVDSSFRIIGEGAIDRANTVVVRSAGTPQTITWNTTNVTAFQE